jgi:predicted kinase
MRFVLEGTSSSGKTTIIKKFPKIYKVIELDDLLRANDNCKKLLKNKYYTQKQRDNMDKHCLLKELGNQMGTKKHVVIDTVNFEPASPKELNKYLPKDIINILIYTNLEFLAINIEERRKYDARGKFVFEQFAEYYVGTTNPNEAIDTVNLKSFIKNLHKMKYEFQNEKELIGFAKDIFKSMNILDDKETFIKPRYNKFHAIINTTGKTPIELKNEIFLKTLNL